MNRLTGLKKSGSTTAGTTLQTQIKSLISLINQGQFGEAISLGEKLAKRAPRAVVIYNILGVANARLRQNDRAIAYLTKALKIKPDYAEAHNNLGLIFKESRRYNEANDRFIKALKFKPDLADALNNQGNTLVALERFDEAIRCFTKSLTINPSDAQTRAARLFLSAHICDWDAIDTDVNAITTLGISGPVVTPFSLLSLEDSPSRHQVRSERYATQKYGRLSPQLAAPPCVKPDRLRIGYFSADFRLHAMMHLMAKLFEVHDRTRFTLHAFSIGPNNGDPMTMRLTEAFDEFHDVQALSDEQISVLARERQIDLAIDLNGYTSDARPGIFAYRPAPVQINYLGYPGTTGAKFMDYIIADKIIIPVNEQKHYSEKIIYLPDAYQANDNSREISNKPMTRSEFGLPDEGFVFCCFNNSQKIGRREFDIWMRLLDQISGSVLWLFKPNNWAEANLKKEAEKRGIDGERVVFAEHLPLSEHLARHRLADLFLDTFNYNAHTTASDALWAGLPLVTRIAQGFAARVAGSLLTAIGLPELITDTDEGYESLALQLASDPERLSAIKLKLKKNRDTTPLFDTERFARHIEEAYQLAYQRHFDGKAPDGIDIQR